MIDKEEYFGFQFLPSPFPNKNDDFNRIIEMMIKGRDSSVISQSSPYS